MRRLGTRKTPTRVAGHQQCPTCHTDSKAGKHRARREAAREIAAESQP